MDTVLSADQREDLGKLAEDANEKLLKAGASSAEQAFGLGCSIGLLPLLILIIALLITGKFNLIMTLIIGAFGALALAGISALLSSRARALAIRRVYQQEIGPEIDAYLGQRGLLRRQFDNLAGGTIPAEAPLRSFLSLSSEDRSSGQ